MQTSLINVIYAPGAGGYFLTQVIKELYKIHHFGDISNTNEYSNTGFPPVLDRFHYNDIDDITKLYRTINIFITNDTDIGTLYYLKSLVDMKHASRNNEIHLCEYDPADAHYRCVIQNEGMDNMHSMYEKVHRSNPSNTIMLNYKTLFLDVTDDAINTLCDLLLIYNNDQRIDLQKRIKKYSYANLERLDATKYNFDILGYNKGHFK